MQAVLKAAVFDWGDTLMRVFPGFSGPMYLWPRVEACPGAEEALNEIPSYMKCCLASNASDSDAGLMERALERVGIRSCFDRLWTSKELGYGKPDPRFFLEIARRLREDPRSCISIGNDYDKDIVPAHEIGMQTVWLSSGKDGRKPAAADFTIRSLFELPALLKTEI